MVREWSLLTCYRQSINSSPASSPARAGFRVRVPEELNTRTVLMVLVRRSAHEDDHADVVQR